MPRTPLLLPVLIAVLSIAELAAGPGPDLSGAYRCSGINPDGSSYENVVVEIVRYNDAYQLLWSVDSEPIAIGMGVRTGDVFAVSYLADVPGVAAYRIEPGGRLVGEWTLAGLGGRLFQETLVRTSTPATLRPRQVKPSLERPIREL